MLAYKTPGVYIEEIPATGPIAGVGTSTAAFLGPAIAGPMKLPTKVTNWSQYKSLFTDPQSNSSHYLSYAVRGFFENGGTIAYIVRVDTVARAVLDLPDRGNPPGTALRVEAKHEGSEGNSIEVAVTDSSMAATKVANPRAAFSRAKGNTIELKTPAEAGLFRPFDFVTIVGTQERYQIDRIDSEGGKLILASALPAEIADKVVRIADLVPEQNRLRVEKGEHIDRGSVIRLTQGNKSEDCSVDRVADDVISLTRGIVNTYPLETESNQVDVTTREFTVAVNKAGEAAASETFANLSMDPRHRNYFGKDDVVKSKFVKLSLPPTPSSQPFPKNLPAPTPATKPKLQGGKNDETSNLAVAKYQDCLAELDRVDDVNLVCAPGRSDKEIQSALVEHCERMLDRFAILDSAANLPPFGPGSVIDQRANVVSKGGYAALYYPWIQVSNPNSQGSEPFYVPPSGHVAGIFARSDSQRGVHKAPANEFIAGALGVERMLTDAEQGELNVEGINALRIFPGQRPIVWGARTTAPREETPWRYVNVRRLFLFVEESIQEGIRWAVFEPNDYSLWKKLERTLTEFLNRVWRSGALFGKTAAEAFYVKIDDELNPPSVQKLGQVVIEIGIAPVQPAEFVVVRIAMWDGGSQATES
jgi:phage tail sheath protein FI